MSANQVSSMLSHYWKLFYRAFSARSFFGRRIDFGFWIRYTVDVSIPLEEGDIYSGHDTGPDPRFRYPPLKDDQNHIRLFRLLPGHPGQPLHGEILLVRLEDKPCYEAVSYVWGNTSFDGILHINDRPLNISRLLAEELHQYRSETTAHVLWIDQICVNQQNIWEKNSQVRLMLKIYAQATNVVVWLGKELADTGAAVTILKMLLEGDTENVKRTISEIPFPLIEPGITDFMARNWWKRYWVVQEAVMARHVVMICGSLRLSWTPANFAQTHASLQLAKWLVLSPQWEESGLGRIALDPLIDLLERQSQRSYDCSESLMTVRSLTYIDLMYLLRTKYATIPQDRIYAVHGLAELMHIPGMPEVDYSWPVREAFERVIPEMRLLSVASTRQHVQDLSTITVT